MYRIRARGFSVDQGSDGRVAAQLVQAAAPGGPDAPDWHAQPDASSPLSHRAAVHLETAGRAADDRDDALAATNLLTRAAALLPRDAPALARLYTSLGAALTEAGQLEQARATLDHAQRIAADNGDEGQRAHARRVIHSSYYRVFSDGNSGDWIGEMLSTFSQPKMNIY